MGARTEKDGFFLLTFGMPITSGGIAFVIETIDEKVVNDLVDFIFMYDDKTIYEISKLVKKKVLSLDVWCRVRMLNEDDYEIAENKHPREGVNLHNQNLLDELAGSHRSLDEIKKQKKIKIVGFRKTKNDDYAPYINVGGNEKHVDERVSRDIASDAIKRFCKT